jgi:type I restriction enzyme, S subunit
MKQYTKMKDSGVNEIGNIPDRWDVIKGRFFIIIRGSVPKIIENSKGVHFFKVDDLNNTSQNFILQNSSTYVFSKNKPISKHSILIPKRGEAINTNKVTICQTECYVDSNVMGLEIKNGYEVKFFAYFLFARTLRDVADKTTIPQINNKHIKPLLFPIPELITEQKNIAKFLDSQTSKIDSEIKKNEKLVTLLQEKRQATINHAVTKGLDNSVPMKDSGVEWIGDIPKEWSINKIKFTSYVKGRIGFHGLRSEEFTDIGAYLITGTDFKNGQIRWSTCHHVELWRYEQDPYIQIKKNDILITKDGTIGKIALVENVPDKTTLNSGVMVVRPLKREFEPRYFFWLLKSNQFMDFISMIKSGSTIQHLYQETFENFQFTLPILDEQNQIVEFLDTQTKQFDELISKAKLQIKTLQEYRQSLILSAVTGKIDVREAIA